MSIASPFRLVNKTTLENIHAATLDILSQTGIVFQSPECLKIFKTHGARVQGQTVFIAPDMVEKAIASAPASFEWAGRNPEHNILVGKGQEGIHVSFNNGPIYIQDQDHGRRLGARADLVNLYKLAQHSKVCNINGQIPVEPSDITHPKRYLDIFHELLTHTDKPLFGYVGTQKEVGQMFDMIKISLGGGDEVLAQKRIAVSLNPLSPLRYDEIPCETLLAYAKHGQPIMVLVCAMAGVTAPVSPMGVVTLQNAEILAGLVLSQLVNPGTPFIYSPASAIPNMKTASYITGSPESTQINMVGIQLARELYDIPSRCMAGLTDAKTVDCQAGYETMQNYLMLAMAGVNMVNECYGILDSIMTVSYEKFIIDDEIMARAARAVGDIHNLDDDFSKGLIHELGHGGAYLMHPSTMKHCRNFWTPSVSSCDSYEDWQKKGAMDVETRANGIFKQILAECPDKMISDDIDDDLKKFIQAQ